MIKHILKEKKWNLEVGQAGLVEGGDLLVQSLDLKEKNCKVLSIRSDPTRMKSSTLVKNR